MCGKDFIAQTTIQRRSPLDVGIKEAIANAQLISAAPELLEACKQAVTYFEEHKINGFEIGDCRRAIAKAEGSAE